MMTNTLTITDTQVVPWCFERTDHIASSYGEFGSHAELRIKS